MRNKQVLSGVVFLLISAFVLRSEAAGYRLAMRSSFQVLKKCSKATVTMAGIAWGIMIEMSIRSGLAPSSMAASSRSRGILLKFCLSRKM